MSSVDFVLDSLDTGRKMELEGIKFYNEAAETIEDTMGKGTLNFLANEEKEHLKFINNLSQSFKENEGGEKIAEIIKDHKNQMERPKIFSDKEEYKKKIKSGNAEKEILKEAKKVEERSIKFYNGCHQNVNEAIYKEVFEMLLEEENKHLEWVEMMQSYMDVHGYWYDLDSYFANE